ncbi:MAG: hypothetical protein ACR2P6_11295, partial [Gammaproteobacteria bacterium]
ARSRLILADDESDLVYHMVCSRDRGDGEPGPGFSAGDAFWFTTDHANPRSEEMPSRYEAIFSRTMEFNEDCVQHRKQIEREKWSLVGEQPERYPVAVQQIDNMFVIADWLAIYFQKRFSRMLRATHILAVLMGLAFIVYSDLLSEAWMIFVFLGLFGLGILLFALAQKGAWHRKYLDYRALAEGMRVQFYWAAAGVKGDEATKYTHDNFLQKQDVELGWIRNVMRVAGLSSDVDIDEAPVAVADTVIKDWIGDDDSGQLGYYQMKAASKQHLNELTESIGNACLAGGVVVALVLAFVDADMSTTVGSILIVLMGILPLIAAVRDAYAHKKADKELIKQYRFMHRIFFNARRHLDSAGSDKERLDILRALGEAALDEHAEWILIHRERPLEIGKL